MVKIEVISYNKKFSEDFYTLNKLWIEESWSLEDSDKEDLLNPEKIIKKVDRYFLLYQIIRQLVL